MTVSTGSLVQNEDLTGLLERVGVVLGNGNGATGYGQRVTSFENLKGVDTTNDIEKDHWNALRTDINTCSQHQSNNNIVPDTVTAGNIIGADASGPSVTRITGDTFSIDTPDADQGVNDWFNGVSTIESNANQIATGNFELTTTRAFASSTRTSSWGGAGANQAVYAEIAVQFSGGYETTNTSGDVITATGADHFRHFFNASGEIRLSAFLNGSTAKDTDWGTLLGNSGFIIFGKNSTTSTGTGRARDGSTDVDGTGGIESALGSRQLSTGYQIIFQKNGSQTEYQENYFAIYAKRNVAYDTVTFFFEFNDVDSGDKTGTGPAVDEPVLSSGGSMGCGIDLKRPNANVTIEEPAPDIITELRFT